MRFKDKVVVVTGGSAGIGRAAADRFAREGAIVAINGSRADRVEAAVTEVIGSGGRAFEIVGDVTDREAAGFASEQPEQYAKFCANIPLQRLAKATEQAESRIRSSCSTKKLLMRRRISKLFIARRMNRASAATCSWLAGITIAFRADPANGVYRDARLISIGFAISATPAIGRPGHTASAMTPRTSVRRMKRDGPSSERCSSRAARLFD